MAWLANERTNTYGGVYTWVDRAAMEAYLHSDIFIAVSADPNLVAITSRDFDLLDGPSRITQALVAGPRDTQRDVIDRGRRLTR